MPMGTEAMHQAVDQSGGFRELGLVHAVLFVKLLSLVLNHEGVRGIRHGAQHDLYHVERKGLPPVREKSASDKNGDSKILEPQKQW